MLLWSFIFADPEHKLLSARVRADSRSLACSLMEVVTMQRLDPSQHNPARGVILHPMGKMDGGAEVLSVVRRDGLTIEIGSI